MLNSINLDDKRFEEKMEEALAMVSLHTDEWTNFNVADPGVTMLQNFTAFNILQQSYINEVSDKIREKLLKIVGITPLKLANSKVFLHNDKSTNIKLVPQQKFLSGELCFECQEETVLHPIFIKSIYTKNANKTKDVSFLLEEKFATSVSIFGDNPTINSEVYILLSEFPPLNKKFVMFADVVDSKQRNPIKENFVNDFSDVVYEYFTEDGFVQMETQDKTYGYLTSGTITLTARGNAPAAQYNGFSEKGYAIRVRLKSAQFVLPPKIKSLTPNLFEVVQKNTRAKSFKMPGNLSVTVSSFMAKYNCMVVYVRESKNGGFYEYKPSLTKTSGRFYTIKTDKNGVSNIHFNKASKNIPCKGKDNVLIVCYDDVTIHHKKLAKVYGYENQIVEINLITNIIEDDFSLLVAYKKENDERVFEIVKPNEKDETKLNYSVISNEGTVVINSPGMQEEQEIFLCDCAQTNGEDGNIRAGNEFVALGVGDETLKFSNPSCGEYGTSKETPEQLRIKFINNFKKPTTAVKASDYESIVKNTQGLCIHKVKAKVDYTNNIVKIAVKPYSNEKFAKLTPTLFSHVEKEINDKRLITTRFEILNPQYVEINVAGSFFVKSYIDDARKIISEYISEFLDGVTTNREFGESISFTKLYKELGNLDVVESIHNLSIVPNSFAFACMSGSDIKLSDFALSFAGQLELEIKTKNGNVL